MSVAEKIAKHPPYKLLALDGGGIRGIIALEILLKIQEIIQGERGADDRFVLADYFDYIGGTSTGAIIATFLTLGWRVERIRDFYVNSGAEMFDRAAVLRRFHYRFEDEKLAALLQREIGRDTTLGDERIRTLLLLVLRNATTDSPWPLSNNPRGKYNDPSRPDNNLKLPLWQLVRASSAAPTYFPPETIEIGGRRFIFVDGGVTMYNNPAFQLFLMATLEPYRLGWPTGEKQMLLVSVGTGTSPSANENLVPGEMNLLYNASSIPAALMTAASNEQDFLCRVFGRTLCGDALDRELGDMLAPAQPLPPGPVPGPVHPKLFTYMRYNAELTRTGLDALGLANTVPEHVQQLDSVDHIADLQTVGRAVAARKVRKEHFEGFLADAPSSGTRSATIAT